MNLNLKFSYINKTIENLNNRHSSDELKFFPERTDNSKFLSCRHHCTSELLKKRLLIDKAFKIDNY